MTAGQQFYEGHQRKSFTDVGCIRRPNYDRAPKGVATFDALLNAVADQELHIPKLRTGMLHWRLDDITGDTENCRECLQSGVIADILQSMPRLEDLIFMFDVSDAFERCISLSHVIPEGHRWSSLTNVTLDCVDCERSELWAFLSLHKDTLKGLCLREVLLTKGSWKRLLADIRKGMRLEDPCICGTIRGGFVEEEDGSLRQPEVYELSIPEVQPCDMRSSINCYCSHGGELYPDELPLTEDIVRKYYESHVRRPGMVSDAEDDILMQEAYERRAERFWSSDSSDDDDGTDDQYDEEEDDRTDERRE
ncbi:hypothetical protein PG994_009683 [Apiospora phragmitis]|uniref:Uncharacterized protein n=1 Tax=Apiospora phragmitis TaxID=2905665 RepID=A0ABR1U6T9_9PEZI